MAIIESTPALAKRRFLIAGQLATGNGQDDHNRAPSGMYLLHQLEAEIGR